MHITPSNQSSKEISMGVEIVLWKTKEDISKILSIDSKYKGGYFWKMSCFTMDIRAEPKI